MAKVNFEFKAKTNNLPGFEKLLLELNPVYIGEDYQVDTYFNVTSGRLKLREGNIENALIYYERINSLGAKQSNILLYQHQPDKALKEILEKVQGIKIVVEKRRKIYFIDNVKFHFDTVTALGTFIEVEAIDSTGDVGIGKLQEQCDFYAKYFNLVPSDYIAFSYSDLLYDNKK